MSCLGRHSHVARRCENATANSTTCDWDRWMMPEWSPIVLWGVRAYEDEEVCFAILFETMRTVVTLALFIAMRAWFDAPRKRCTEFVHSFVTAGCFVLMLHLALVTAHFFVYVVVMCIVSVRNLEWMGFDVVGWEFAAIGSVFFYWVMAMSVTPPMCCNRTDAGTDVCVEWADRKLSPVVVAAVLPEKDVERAVTKA